MITRRTFLKYTAGGTMLTLFGFDKLTGTSKAIAAIPGGTLDLAAVPKFVTPMLIPPVMPRAATITMPGGKPADYYEISMRQISQQILPAGLPATTV
jgi:spore coat protein A